MKNLAQPSFSKNTQLSFLNEKIPRYFGGNFLKGNPKSKRPLSTKHTLHLVLKSEQALGKNSMLQKKNASAIDRLIRKQAQLCGIKIYHLVNVGNHLHLVIRISNRELYKKYIRSVTGLIARHVLQKQRGTAIVAVKPTLASHRMPEKEALRRSTRTKKFWVARPFTRLIQWGKDFRRISQYMNKNHRQALFIAWGFETTNLEDIYLLNTG